MKGRVLLIRHSLTAANEKRLYCGRTDIPLSPKGKALAEKLARSGRYKAGSSCRFFTSGMKRTDETLSILFGNVKFEVLPELREMDFGEFEMLSYEELKDRKDYQIWISGDNFRNKCPGGESAEEMTERAIRAADMIFRNEYAAAVTHGGIIAAVMAHFFPHENKNRYQWQPEPAGGYLIFLDNGVPVGYDIIKSETVR